MSDWPLLLVEALACVERETVEEAANEIGPALFMVVTMNAFKATTPNLINVCHWIESDSLVTSLLLTASDQEVVELFDGGWCLVAAAVVVPQIEEGLILIFDAGDDRERVLGIHCLQAISFVRKKSSGALPSQDEV